MRRPPWTPLLTCPTDPSRRWLQLYAPLLAAAFTAVLGAAVLGAPWSPWFVAVCALVVVRVWRLSRMSLAQPVDCACGSCIAEMWKRSQHRWLAPEQLRRLTESIGGRLTRWGGPTELLGASGVDVEGSLPPAGRRGGAETALVALVGSKCRGEVVVELPAGTSSHVAQALGLRGHEVVTAPSDSTVELARTLMTSLPAPEAVVSADESTS